MNLYLLIWIKRTSSLDTFFKILISLTLAIWWWGTGGWHHQPVFADIWYHLHVHMDAHDRGFRIQADLNIYYHLLVYFYLRLYKSILTLFNAFFLLQVQVFQQLTLWKMDNNSERHWPCVISLKRYTERMLERRWMNSKIAIRSVFKLEWSWKILEESQFHYIIIAKLGTSIDHLSS